VGPDVVPEFAAIVDRLGLEHQSLEPIERLEVFEVGRHPGVGQRLENLRAGGLEPGVEPVPVGRIRGEREHNRDVPPQFVGDPDRLVSVANADVDVNARRRVSVLWVLDTVELRAIKGFLRVLEFLPLRQRVEAGGRDAIAVVLGVFDQCLADREQRVAGVVGRLDHGVCSMTNLNSS